MNVRSQISTVFHLDKCIGCHTCSVACKNQWTDRRGLEYAWWNNVETKPGTGYPSSWRTRSSTRGLEEDGDGLKLRQGGRLASLARIFSNPLLPCSTTTTNPSRTTTATSSTPRRGTTSRPRGPSPSSTASPWRSGAARTGRRSLRVAGLRGTGSEPGRPLRGGAGRVAGHRADGLLLPASHLQPLPERRLRRRLPVRGDRQAGRGRHRPREPGPLPRLAHVRVGLPVQEDLLQLVHREVGEVHPLLPPARGRRGACLLPHLRGRIRYLGVLLYDADKLLEVAGKTDAELVAAQRSLILDRSTRPWRPRPEPTECPTR